MDTPQTTETKHSWLSQLWLGEIPLAKAFWLYGVLVFFTVKKIGTTLDDAAIQLGWYTAATIVMDAVCGLESIYWIIWSVGVLRSSIKYNGPGGWRELAIAAVIFQFVTVAIHFALLALKTAASLSSK